MLLCYHPRLSRFRPARTGTAAISRSLRLRLAEIGPLRTGRTSHGVLTTRTATMQPRLLSADRIQSMPPMTSHEPDATPPPPALLTTAPAIEALLPAALALTAISRDRSLGVMYGLAVGNVLGIPVEF